MLTSCLGRQPVERVVALTHSADLAAEGELCGGREGTTVGIDVSDGDLDRGVVLRGDQAVYGRRIKTSHGQSLCCRSG